MGSGTMARTIATGRGKVYARLAIEGWPYIFCTDKRLEKTFSNGQIQAVGLNLEGVRLSCQAEIERAQVRADGFQAKIADVAKVATLAFGKRPQQTTELTAELTTSATSATVQSTAGFAATGVVHINTEAIEYTGKTSTTFTGLTRGAWGTIAQKHYVGTGKRLAPPRVTDLPEALGGRRVWLYLYDEGDAVIKDPATFAAPAGADASIRWRGVATTDVSYQAGLWSFTVDPLTAVLGQSIGSDVEEGVMIRGIYIPWNRPVLIRLTLHTGPESNDGIAAKGDIMIPTAAGGGFFETREEFMDEIKTQITAITATSAWTSSGFGTSAGDAQITAYQTDAGFQFVYYTNSTPGDELFVSIQTDEPGSLGFADRLQEWWIDARNPSFSENYVQIVEEDETYHSHGIMMSFPHGRVGSGPTGGYPDPSPWSVPDAAAIAPEDRIYISGDVELVADMGLVVTGDGAGGVARTALTVDTTDNYITVSSSPKILTQNTVLKFGRRFGSSSGTTIAGFRQALVDNAPTLVNRGGAPLLTDNEIPSSVWDPIVEDSVAGLSAGSNRVYIAYEATSVTDLVGADLALIGCYLSINSTGQVVPNRLRFAPETAYGLGELTARNVGGEFPTAARSGVGTVGEVIISSGYDAAEDKWEGVKVRVRDVQNAAVNRLCSGKKLSIEPKSVRHDYDGSKLEFDPLDAERMTRPLLGIFSAPYESWTVEADATKMNISVGDTVLVTSSLIPSTDGTMGITRRPALVVGWEYEPLSGRATFDLIATLAPIAGYAPSFLVVAPINVTANQWAITCSIGGYASGDGVDWMPAAARVRVQKAGSSESSIAGTVDSWSTVTCTVTLDSAWTPGSDRWYLSSGTAADSITSAQELFCYMGDTLRSIPFPTAKQSRELAP